MRRRNPPPEITKDLIYRYSKRAPYVWDRLLADWVKKHPGTIMPGGIIDISRVMYPVGCRVDFVFRVAVITEKMRREMKSPYIEAVTRWVINESVDDLTDYETTRDALIDFHDAVQRGALRGKDADILTYEKRTHLMKVLRKLKQGEGATYFEIPGCHMLGIIKYDKEAFRLYEVTTYPAAKEVFSNTGWCVVHEQHFNYYKPPFFLVTQDEAIDGSEEKPFALMHVNSAQCKDVVDDPIPLDDNRAKHILPFIKKVFPKYFLDWELGDLGGHGEEGDITGIRSELLQVIEGIAEYAADIGERFWQGVDYFGEAQKEFEKQFERKPDMDDPKDEEKVQEIEGVMQDDAWEYDDSMSWAHRLGMKHLVCDTSYAADNICQEIMKLNFDDMFPLLQVNRDFRCPVANTEPLLGYAFKVFEKLYKSLHRYDLQERYERLTGLGKIVKENCPMLYNRVVNK